MSSKNSEETAKKDIVITIEESDHILLKALARANNMSPEQVLLESFRGKVRSTPKPMQELFNEMVALSHRMKNFSERTGAEKEFQEILKNAKDMMLKIHEQVKPKRKGRRVADDNDD